MRSNPLVKSADRTVGRVVFAALSAHDRARRALSAPHRRAAVDDAGAVLGDDVRSIVAIKLCCLGDGILAVPALRALKTRWPGAELAVVCTPRSVAAFDTLPFVDRLEVLPLTGHAGLREIASRGWAAVPALGRLRASRPQLAVDLDLYFKATPIVAYLTGAPVRIGFDTDGAGRAGLFTHSVPRDPEQWELECFLDVVQLAAGTVTDRRLEYNVPSAATALVQQLLSARGVPVSSGYLAMCPGSSKNWPAKQWAPERFAEVARWAHAEHGLRTVLVGASFERDLAQTVALQAGEGVLNLAGETSVAETAAVLQGSRALVTNDTGPMHLACAVGTPVVAVFGPTKESKWGPRGERDTTVVDQGCDCRPCYHLSYMPDCSHRKCLAAIEAGQVISVLAALLAGSGASSVGGR